MEINCPQCSANLDLRRDDRFLRCEYCSSTLIVDGGIGAQTFIVEPLVDEDGAIGYFRKLLEQLGSRSGAAMEAMELELAVEKQLLPFREREGPKGKSLELASEVAVSFDGLHRLQGERLACDDSLLPEWRRLALSESESQHKGEDKSFIVYYPMYRLDYSFGGGDYVLMIDGVSSKAFADELPPFPPAAANLPFFLILLASFLAYMAMLHLLPLFLPIRLLITLLFVALFTFLSSTVVGQKE